METGGRARTERRLAAILAADVAGYSRLIGADEEGTLNRLTWVKPPDNGGALRAMSRLRASWARDHGIR